MRNKWKPKQGERYFFVSEQKGVLWDYFDTNNTNAKTRFYIGNCFKTTEQASENFEDIAEKITYFYNNF